MNPHDPMRDWVSSFPEMLDQAWDTGLPSPAYPLDPGRILFLGGMGGSGMAGALAAIMLSMRGRPALTGREAVLPPWLDPSDRFILASYSGETVEAVAMLREAVSRKIPTRVVTSGGRVRAECQELTIPCFPVPVGLAPRASLPWLLAGVLRAAGGTEDREIAEASILLREELGNAAPERDPVAIARSLAGRLVCLLPFGGAMETVALRWRNQILENAKQAAVVSPLPEMAHNEVMGWPWLREAGIPLSFVILVEEWPLPGPWGGLIAALRAEASRNGFPVHLTPPAPGRGLGALLAQVLLGDRISVELATLRGVDAMPVDVIQRLRGAFGKEQRP